MGMIYAICVGAFFSLFYTQVNAQAPTHAALLLVTKRDRPRMGKMDYFILARSSQTGQWSSFITALKDDEKLADAAARALYEQVAVPHILGVPYEEFRDYMDLAHRHTWFVVDNHNDGRVVTYITYLKARQVKHFKECMAAYLESNAQSIDAFAFVRWENIELALRHETNKVYGHIANSGQCQCREEYCELTMSNEFINSIKPFLTRQSYEQGQDRRVRIYGLLNR